MIVKDTSGVMHDLSTGQVVGRTEDVSTTAGPRAGGEGALEQVVSNPIEGMVNNFSWGFNSALFALPDAAQRLIGKGLGLNDDQVFQFAKFFNRGQVAPRNITERFSKAIGEGIGGGLPLTGYLAGVARMRPMVTAAEPTASVLKGIANDAIQYIQKNPKGAFIMDAAFGAAHEGLRQAVEETVSNDDPHKPFLKEFMPTAALVGAPLAWATISPAALAYRFGKNLYSKQKGLEEGLAGVEKQAIEDLPKGYKLPLINIAPKIFASRAREKLVHSLGASAETDEGQAALKMLDEIMQDPRVAAQGFRYNIVEKTMDPRLTERSAQILSQLPEDSPVLKALKQQQNENRTKWSNLIDEMAPGANMDLPTLLTQLKGERQASFDNIISQRQGITDVEKARLAETYGPLNPDTINGEIRGLLMAQMELDADMRRKFMRSTGMSQGVDKNGVPVAVRDPQTGKSLISSVPIEQPATALVDKWNNLLQGRKTMSRDLREFIGSAEPISILRANVAEKVRARDAMENKMANDLLREKIDAQLEDSSVMRRLKQSVAEGRSQEVINAEQERLDGIRRLAELLVKSQRSGAKLSRAEKSRLEMESGFGASIVPESGDIKILLNRGEYLTFNPKTIAADAKRIANESNPIDINVPEALDYLEAAMRFRNKSLIKYNEAMAKGQSGLTDANQYKAIGDEVFHDVEKLVLDNVPRVRAEREAMKVVLDDYRSVYEQRLPLLIGKQGNVAGGRRYATSNEQVLATAFRSADDVRNLSTMLGNDARGKQLLEQGTFDWLQRKNIFDRDGLIDPKKLTDVLQKNQNIVSALPKDIQASLKNEAQTAESVAARMGKLKEQEQQLADADLDKFLTKAVRPGSDKVSVLSDALSDPPRMAMIVNAVKKDPEQLAALRRAVFETAGEAARAGAPMARFLDTHDRSLKLLFDESHLKALRTLADLQARNQALAKVTGSVPAFESLSDVTKRLMGVSVPGMMTYARDVASGRVSTQGTAVGLSMRLLSSMEESLQNKMLIRAIEDPAFAKALSNPSTEAAKRAVAREIQSFGLVPRILARGIEKQGTYVMEDQSQLPIEGRADMPVVPRETAQQMLRKLPPAPATRGVEPPNLRLPTGPTASPMGPLGRPIPTLGQMSAMYPAMFPNDPISALLQQRAAQQPPQ